jgi:hypothetical protein
VIVLITKIKKRPSMAALSMSAEKKAYPLRIGADVLNAVQHWGDDELRSINAQIEYVLRDALRKAGRLKPANELRAPRPRKNN